MAEQIDREAWDFCTRPTTMIVSAYDSGIPGEKIAECVMAAARRLLGDDDPAFSVDASVPPVRGGPAEVLGCWCIAFELRSLSATPRRGGYLLEGCIKRAWRRWSDGRDMARHNSDMLASCRAEHGFTVVACDEIRRHITWDDLVSAEPGIHAEVAGDDDE